MNILDLNPEQFQSALRELAQQGVNTDELMRQYERKNSVFSGIYDWADQRAADAAEAGRQPLAMGLLSKEAGTTGMDALRSVDVEPLNFIAGLLADSASAIDAPASAARGLVPADDMTGRALGTAGFAQVGGAAASKPSGALGMGSLRQFDVTRKDASNIFGSGTERVRYTDPQSGGTMEVVVRPDGSASVLELEVPEASRGKGIGQSLQERVMQDYPVMGGQVSSKAAATTAYRLGRRPYGQPNATLDDVFRMIDENSSVNLISPQAQPVILPAARNEAERMARDILEMRAAGRASEVTDAMMAQADQQYMFNNTPLPMDEASRMARAGEMGFGGDRYHGSNMDFQNFSGSAFTSDNPTVASTYNRGMNDAVIYPLMTRDGVGGTVNVEGGLSNWNQLRPDMIDVPYVARELDMGMPISTRDVERQAKFEGFSGVNFNDINDLGPGFNSQQFKNIGYTPEQAEAMRVQYLTELSSPSNVDVRFYPSLLRSRFARFDPEFSHLANLNAANASPLAGLLALQSEEDRNRALRTLLGGF